MALLEELKKLKDEGQPQTLDELFRQSKEGMMADNVINQINTLLPQIRDRLFQELLEPLTETIKREVGNIRIRDGNPGRDGEPGKTPSRELLKTLIKEVMPKPEKKELSVDDIKGLRVLFNDLSSRISSIKGQRDGKRGGGGTTFESETLTLAADGSSATLSFTPVNSNNVMVFYNGSLLTRSTNYTISGRTITFLQPVAGSESYALYQR